MTTPEKSEPYVGVSGIISEPQQEMVHYLAEMTTLTEYRRILVGVKAVHKTQYLDVENKYGREWYPVGDEIKKAFDTSVPTFNVAQMYLEPSAIAEDPDYPIKFVDKVVERLDGRLHGIQFDRLPYNEDPEAFRRLLRYVKELDLELILQCHGSAMAEGVEEAIEKIKRLESEIDFVLFDGSHGTGKEMNSEALLRYLDEFYNDPVLNETYTAIAGGLGKENTAELLDPIVREFQGMSWDAESNLHNAENGRLNLAWTHEYLSGSQEVLQQHPGR